MKIVFNKAFYNSDYATDGASAPGRLEAIMDTLLNGTYLWQYPSINQCFRYNITKSNKAF